MPAPLGSINCYCPMEATSKLGKFAFDATIKGLSIAAQTKGLKAGDVVRAFDTDYTLTDVSTYDDRANGIWPLAH